jgi:hypothetical protein
MRDGHFFQWILTSPVFFFSYLSFFLSFVYPIEFNCWFMRLLRSLRPECLWHIQTPNLTGLIKLFHVTVSDQRVGKAWKVQFDSTSTAIPMLVTPSKIELSRVFHVLLLFLLFFAKLSWQAWILLSIVQEVIQYETSRHVDCLWLVAPRVINHPGVTLQHHVLEHWRRKFKKRWPAK